MSQVLETPIATAASVPAAKAFSAPDLTKRAPRSPRQRLGGFAILPRTIDKGRAKAAGAIGEYHYACPLDQRLFKFVGIDGDGLLEQIKANRGDGEILAWVHEHGKHPRADWEIAAWSDFQDRKTPDSVKGKERAAQQITAINPARTDILTGFDLLDLDDHVSFGGRP
jgi:Domain of unknown function (DUF5069)